MDDKRVLSLSEFSELERRKPLEEIPVGGNRINNSVSCCLNGMYKNKYNLYYMNNF